MVLHRSKLVSLFLITVIAVSSFACSGTASSKPNITPDQAWRIGINSAKAAGVAVILTQSKDGKILGVSSADAIEAVAPVVDTLAADFKPGALADEVARAKTRQTAAVQFARNLFKKDFAATDESAKARQDTDIAAIRAIVDAVADSLLATFGK